MAVGSTITTIFDDFSIFMDDHFFTPATLMVVISICLMLVAITGCIGAVKESTMLVNVVSKSNVPHEPSITCRMKFYLLQSPISSPSCCLSCSRWNLRPQYLPTLCMVKLSWCWFVQWMSPSWCTRTMLTLRTVLIFSKQTWVELFNDWTAETETKETEDEEKLDPRGQLFDDGRVAALLQYFVDKMPPGIWQKRRCTEQRIIPKCRSSQQANASGIFINSRT